MTMHARHAGDEDRRETGGSQRPAPDPDGDSREQAPVTDPRVVGQLPGAQLQRLTASLQGSHGNRRVAELVASVQRAPTGSDGDRRRAGSVRIEALTARVNAKPSFTARPVATLSRGDVVTPTGERRGGWHLVTTGDGVTGWLHETSWKTTKPSLTSEPGGPGGTEPEEIEIGGRG